MIKKSKSGRKTKVNISEEDLKGLDENTISPKEISEKYSVSTNTIYQIKHKRKLKMSNMELVEPDPLITASNQADVKKIEPAPIAPESVGQTLPQKQFDYDVMVSGLWSAVDGMCVLMTVLFRGKIEYKKLTKQEIETLTEATKRNSWIQKLSTMDQMSNLVMLGTVAVVFNGRFKIKHEEKHNNKDPQNCKCKKCLEEQKQAAQEVETDTVETVEELKTETAPTDLNNIVDTVNIMQQEQLLKSDSGAVPVTNDTSSIKTDAEVLAQNKTKSEGEKNLGKVFQW